MENQGTYVATMVVMSIVIVILALALIKAKWPASTAGKDITILQGDAIAGFKAAGADIRGKVEPLVMRAEIGVGDELSKMLAAVETRLKDTSGEDAEIAAAQQYLARVAADVQARVDKANAAKTAKVAALQLHVATLTSTAGS